MSRSLIDTLFPGDPSIGAAEVSEEYARLRHEANEYRKRMGERDSQQERDSKCQPLTENEALWRIELALLRVARGIEQLSNDLHNLDPFGGQ